MRLYPVLIFIQGVTVYFIFFGVTKIDFLNNSGIYDGDKDWDDIIVDSIFFTIYRMPINLFLQTILYFLRDRLRNILLNWNKFILGVIFNIPALVIWVKVNTISNFWRGHVIAMTICTLISGLVYYWFNKGHELDKTKIETN